MILVTGATGFVGRQVVKALASKGMGVRALVHTPIRSGVVQAPGVQTCIGNVLDPSTLASAMKGAEAVVHLVAIIREKKGLTFARVNAQGTANVVKAAKEAGISRLVHVSALGAQGEPSLPYLYSKWVGEQEVIRSGIPYTILRPSIQFGEGDEFINTLAGLVKTFPFVPVAGSGKAVFQPIHVQDVAHCATKALESKDLQNVVVDIGGPEHVTYNDILGEIAKTLGVFRIKIHIPIPMMRVSVAFMEAVLPRPPVTLRQLDMLKIDNYTDLDSVEKTFGFEPRSMSGNIDYIKRITYWDAIKISYGLMPYRIRDH